MKRGVVLGVLPLAVLISGAGSWILYQKAENDGLAEESSVDLSSDPGRGSLPIRVREPASKARTSPERSATDGAARRARVSIAGFVEGIPEELENRFGGVVLLARTRPGGDGDVAQLAHPDQSLHPDPLQTSFWFPDLEPGPYVLGLTRRPGGPVVVHRVIEAMEGAHHCDLVLPPLRPADCLRVRAVGPGGRALEDVSFFIRQRVEFRRPVSQWSPRRFVDTDVERGPGGRWLVSQEERDTARVLGPWPPGTSFTLEARSSSCGLLARALNEGEHDVLLEFPDPGFFWLELAAPDAGEEALDLDLELRSEGWTRWRRFEASWNADEPPVADSPEAARRGAWKAVLGPNGERIVGPIVPGDYDLRVWLGERDALLGSRRVQVRGGRNPLRLELPSFHTVQVDAPELAPGSDLSLIGRSGSEIEAVVGDDGRATFRRVPTGRYLIRDTSVVPCEVPSPGPVVYRQPDPDRLFITVGDPLGAWGQMGFVDGDTVVSIQGQGFSTMAELGRVVESVRGTETMVSLEIERAGEVVSLEVPVEVFSDDPDDFTFLDVGDRCMTGRR